MPATFPTQWLARLGFVALFMVHLALPLVQWDQAGVANGDLLTFGVSFAMSYLVYLGFAQRRRNDIALTLIALILLQAVAEGGLGSGPHVSLVAIDLAAVLCVHIASHLEALRRNIREPGVPVRQERRRPPEPAAAPNRGQPIRAWVVD